MVRFTSLESLRAWMAWWVVVVHAINLAGLRDIPGSLILTKLARLATGADTAVNVFMILSGFVITHLILAKQEPYRQYIVRRWFRIFPIFLFCLLLALAVQPLYLHMYEASPWVHNFTQKLTRAELQNTYFWQHFLMHLAMLHGILPDTIFPYSSSTILAPAWSLSLEWQFYLLAPLILSVLVSRVGGFLVGSLLLLMVLILKVIPLDWLYPSFLPLAMPHFLIGIGCRMAIEVKTRPTLIFWGLTIALSASLSDRLAVIIWCIFFAIALYECGYILLNKPAQWIISLIALNPFLAALGKWSYSTYLVHIPIFALFVGGYATFTGELKQSTAWILIVAAMVFVVPLSWILYSVIEKSFINMGSRVATRLAPRGSVAKTTSPE